MKKRTSLLALLPLCFALACGDHGHDHDAADHEDGHAEGGAHAGHHHVAPHGGTLAVIGDEVAQVEFLLDPAVGRLTAFCLDGCAENPVVLTFGRFPVSVEVAGEVHEVELSGVASSLTGETADATSQFSTVVPALAGRASAVVVIGAISIRGAQAEGVRVELAAPHDAHDS